MGAWIKNNFWFFFFGIFATVGTILGIVGVVIWRSSDELIAHGARAEGRVIDLVYNGSSANAVIEYNTEWGGKERFVSKVATSPPAYRIGETVTIWYDPKQPGRATADGFDRWFLPALFGGFFLIFGGIGWGGIGWQVVKKQRREWLRTNGTPVQASLIEASRNEGVKLNGVSPFVIRCQWQDPLSKKVFTFESDPVWFDPTDYISGPALTVLIDPRNPKNYFIDLSFLPEAGN
ncbi:MAG TPA: DUF3592 domain-containing protein [Saprospiraceae bacterium]|nr:DUF3592 domain-containing protein [Saprospiraceae bacterium]HNM27336.1 DUF3592 domain-containing protein [Saprospiraceae bacterium]